MPSEINTQKSRLQRLHPASLIFSIGSILRQFLIPILILLLIGRGEKAELWIMIFALPVAVYSLIKYITLRYRFSESELIVKEGILHRTERHIPYQRIQNIDTTRNIFHRVLCVADVRIQTASGSKPDAELRVLSMSAVEIMRQYVFEYKGHNPPVSNEEDVAGEPNVSDIAGISEKYSGEMMSVKEGESVGDVSHGMKPVASHVIAQNSVSDLLKLGVISNRGMLFVTATMGILWQFNVMPSWAQLEHIIESATGITRWTASTIVFFACISILTAVVVLRLLSIAWSILTLYNFTLMRAGDELNTRFGLFTDRLITIPRHRIQLIDISATLLHRAFKQVGMRARTAGADMRQENSGIRDWLLPLLRENGIKRLLEEVQPELEWDAVEWQRLSQRAKRRVFIRSIIVLMIPSIGLSIWQWPWGALAFAGSVFWAAAYSRVMIKYTRYALSPTAIWFRSGWLSRKLRVVRLSKIQTVSLMESPFDRRHGMVSLRIDTANSGIGKYAISIPYMPIDKALEIYERISAKAAETEFKW